LLQPYSARSFPWLICRCIDYDRPQRHDLE
jgi:hypothetical protein